MQHKTIAPNEAPRAMRTPCPPDSIPSADERLAYWEACFSAQNNPASDDYDGWLARYAPLLRRGGRTLDLGCGSGVSIGALLAQDQQVTACDFSQNAIQSVKARFPGIAAACFDMTTPFPFESAQFSAVVADLSLHYFPWADTQRIFSEIFRVLTPGGCLLARVHAVGQVNPEGLVQLEENYYISGGTPRRYFTRGELEALLSGFTPHTLRETEIMRFGHTKRVFEIAALRP